MAEWLIINLIGPTTKWGFLDRVFSRSAYSLQELPPIFEEEFKDLKTFKQVKILPHNIHRNDIWSPNTAIMRRRDFERILGALALPKDSEDPLLRGLGLDPTSFTLPMFACTKILHWWIQWKGSRRQQMSMLEKGKHSRQSSSTDEGKEQEQSEEKYTEYEASLIFIIGGLFHPKTGWLRQNPGLVEHLKPIPGFIDSSFIRKAKKAWHAVCDEAHEYYQKFGKDIKKVAEQVRDPFEPILPILKMDSPLSALKLFGQNIIDDMPDPATAPKQAAVAMRNYMIVTLNRLTRLRSKNLRGLTYFADDSGELHKEGDKWVIEIDYHQFKNWRSSFFGPGNKKENYRKILLDEDNLYQRIDEYLKVHRPVLLNFTESKIFLVATAESPQFTRTSFYRNYRLLTMRYLAHNPYLKRGIPGVKPHGPHTSRDIGATHVLKKTGREDLAAFAICDHVMTIRKGNYGRFLPQDKMRLIEQIEGEA